MENKKFINTITNSISQFLNLSISSKYLSTIALPLFFLFLSYTSYSFATGWIPEVSLEPSGSVYIGKYSGDSERYNLDAGLDVSFSLLNWKTLDFFIEYISNLEMAKQVGNITLDPRYGHWFIIGGLRYKKGSYIIQSYIVHDCKHIIDLLPDSNKVVFNRLKFSISQNLYDFRKRFQVKTKKKERIRKMRWEFIYGFYPRSKVIDYLNSRPYYHHDFELKLEFPFVYFQKGEIFSGIRGRYTISANNPPKYYRVVSLSLGVFIFNKNGAFGSYLEYFPVAKDPLKSPEGLSIFGIKYLF